MKALELYPLESAEMHLIQSTIMPPIYYVEVSGQTNSLNLEVKVVNTKKIENGYLVLQVEGKDGEAIGSLSYKRSIHVIELSGTEGVLVKGADDRSVKLPWKEVKQLSSNATAGLFALNLQSETSLSGAPILHLKLAVDSVNNTVTGIGTVTQALAEPMVCTSHVTGTLIYESLMKPGTSKIRIDMSGYPEIHWPRGGRNGYVIPKNFTAIILFDENWTSGAIQYQYLSPSGWVKENQAIEIV